MAYTKKTSFGATDPYAQGNYGVQGTYSQDMYGPGGTAPTESPEPTAPTAPPQRIASATAQAPPTAPTAATLTTSPVTATGQVPPALAPGQLPPPPGTTQTAGGTVDPYDPNPPSGSQPGPDDPIDPYDPGQPAPPVPPPDTFPSDPNKEKGTAGQGQDPAPDTSQWDTDGYPPPGYVASDFGPPPAGVDPEKWNNPNHQTPKYATLRMMHEVYGQMGNTPEARQRIGELLMQMYPGSVQVSADKWEIPQLGLIDIFRDVDGAATPQWLDVRWEEQQQQGQQGQQGVSVLGDGTTGDPSQAGGGGGQQTAGGQYGSYTGPVDDRINELLMGLLSSPDLFSQQNVAQMKGSQQELAAQQARDLQQQFGLNTAARGVSGGVEQTFGRRMGDAQLQQLLSSYRDIDLRVPQANREALLNALGTAQGISHGNRSLQLQGDLGFGDLNLRRDILGEDMRQFNTMAPYQQAQIENAILMSRLGYGLDLSQLQLGGQQGMIEWLSGLGK